MKPLLHAPETQCTITKPQCAAKGGVCTTAVTNTGTAPCLYIELSLLAASGKHTINPIST